MLTDVCRKNISRSKLEVNWSLFYTNTHSEKISSLLVFRFFSDFK